MISNEPGSTSFGTHLEPLLSNSSTIVCRLQTSHCWGILRISKTKGHRWIQGLDVVAQNSKFRDGHPRWQWQRRYCRVARHGRTYRYSAAHVCLRVELPSGLVVVLMIVCALSSPPLFVNGASSLSTTKAWQDCEVPYSYDFSYQRQNR